MSATPWDVLGIGETTDPKLIRKAYSQALRHCRPDEDPRAFQDLTESYEWAMAEARRRARDVGNDADAEAHAATTPVVDEHDADPSSARQAGSRELGRSLDAPSDVPSGTDDAEALHGERSFDFGAFFDALAPRLAHGRPEDLRNWLESHPDLFSIDLKWVLIPHLVDTLAHQVQVLRPARGNVAELLAFFGIDARLMRHPALAPALEHIERSIGHLEQRRLYGTSLDEALDAASPDEEMAVLKREIELSKRNRGKVISVDQARLLDLVVNVRSPWWVLLAFSPPGRFADAGTLLEPFRHRLYRLLDAGQSFPTLGTVVDLAEPHVLNRPKALLAGLRLAGSIPVAAVGLWLALSVDITSVLDGMLRAGSAAIGAGALIMAVFAALGLAWNIAFDLLARTLRRVMPWVERQAWEPVRLIAAALCTLLPFAGWPSSTALGLATGFSGMLFAALHQPRAALAALIGTLVSLTLGFALFKVELFGPADTVRLAMALVASGFVVHERFVEKRDLWHRGTPPEGWASALTAAWIGFVVWVIAGIALK